MWIPREREIIARRYGRYVQVTNALKYNPNANTNYGGKRVTDPNTPKARNNCGTAMHKALAIALNNEWQWYGHLWMSNEPVTAFGDVCSFIKKFTKRLQKQRERSESKDLAYLIVPDFTEKDDMQKWYIHIWLMNVPKADTAFVQELASEKKIVYHWTKYERQNGKSKLYKIYASGYTTNNHWQEENAFQIFDIMKRTSPFIPKEKRLYYHSDNVKSDDIIARGKPSTVHEVEQTSASNPYSYSEWLTSLDLQENIDDAMKFLYSYEIDDAADYEWDEYEPILESSKQEPNQQPEESNFSYDNYGYENDDIPPADDYYFYGNTEYYEPVECDYSALNDIYENEVNSYEQQSDDYLFGQTGQNYKPVENFDVIRYC